jgi:hypothetical protein
MSSWKHVVPALLFHSTRTHPLCATATTPFSVVLRPQEKGAGVGIGEKDSGPPKEKGRAGRWGHTRHPALLEGRLTSRAGILHMPGGPLFRNLVTRRGR